MPKKDTDQKDSVQNQNLVSYEQSNQLNTQTQTSENPTDSNHLYDTYQRILHASSVERDKLEKESPGILEGQPFTALVEPKHFQEALSIDETNPDTSMFTGYINLRRLASRTRNKLFHDVVENAFPHVFPTLTFRERVKNGFGINWEQLRITRYEKYSANIRNLYCHTISQPHKIVKEMADPKQSSQGNFNCLPCEIKTLCLTKPAFSLSCATYKYNSHHSLIGLALYFENLELADAYKKQLEALLPDRSFVFDKDEYTSLLERLMEKRLPDSIKWCWALLADSEREAFLQSHGVKAFYHAIYNGHHEIVDLLCELVGNDNQLKKHMLTSACCPSSSSSHNPFVVAAVEGYAKTISVLFRFAGDDIDLKKSMLTVENYGAFHWAVYGGNTDVVRQFCHIAASDTILLQSMLSDENYEVFRDAVKENHPQVLHLLLESMNFDADFKQSFLKNEIGALFGEATDNNFIEIVQLLCEVIGNDTELKKAALTGFRFDCLHRAVSSGSLDSTKVIQLICELASGNTDLKRLILCADVPSIFYYAAEFGQLDIVRMLCDLIGDDAKLKYDVLTARDSDVLRAAADEGHTEVVECLIDLVGDNVELLSMLLTGYHFEVFVYARENQCDALLSILWQSAPQSVQKALCEQQILDEDTVKRLQSECPASRIPSNMTKY